MRNHLLTLAIAVVMCWLLVQATLPKINEILPAHVGKESAFDRVMRTGTIRCGWGAWDGIIIKDTTTGQFSGIFYEYMQAMGKMLNLKIEWTEEIGWGEFSTALDTGRIDAMCAAIWPTGSRAQAMDFTTPIFYRAMLAYVRAGDVRFDHNIESANNENITYIGQDGFAEYQLSQELFPKAKQVTLPQTAPQTDVLLNLVMGKGDIVISDQLTASLYAEKNPGKLHEVAGIEPLNLLGNTVAVKLGEDKFRRMLDNATRDLIQRGAIERIIRKYEKYPGIYYRAAKPYQLPETN